MKKQESVQGTCLSVGGGGILLRGPGGSGKSDLAFRLIRHYPDTALVADDRTELRLANGSLVASCPAGFEGQIELRGLGIARVPFVPETPLHLVIDLVDRNQVPRFPALDPGQLSLTFLSVVVARLYLHAFDASTPAKAICAVSAIMQGKMPFQEEWLS